jgi:hypothetical protein
MIKLNTLILIAMFVQPAFSQTRQKVSQSIEWTSINSTIKLHNRIAVYVEGNFRFVQEFQPQQHQLRTALEFAVGKNFIIAPLGYVYTWNYLYGRQPAKFINNEHRIFQQLAYKNSWRRFSFHQRLRLEERFLQDHSLNNENVVVGGDYSDERFRIRYRTLVNIPINKEIIEAGTLFASIWDEIFLSWGKKVTYHSPDQNRLYVGLGYQVSKPFSIQAGGIHQVIIKGNGKEQEDNYGAMIQLTYNLDFTKGQ